jgi:hypothetical protein
VKGNRTSKATTWRGDDERWISRPFFFPCQLERKRGKITRTGMDVG